MEEHMNNEQGVDFKWKVLRKFRKPLQRQLFEAMTIKNKPKKCDFEFQT